MENKSVAIFILAAGSSSRMGSPKQLVKIGDKNLLQMTTEAASKSKANEVFILLGYQAKLIEKEINLADVQILYNEDWNNGIGTSVKLAAKELLTKHLEFDSAIFTVCDLPYLTESHFDKLINTHLITSKPIIASSYNGINGVPALFDRSQFAKLLVIPDHTGAKPIIDYAQPEDITTVPFEEGLLDIDYPEDLLEK